MRIPIFALASMDPSAKASPPMKQRHRKPDPAQPTGAVYAAPRDSLRQLCDTDRTASHEANTIPSGYPAEAPEPLPA
jgi:hypothetical protein